MNAPGSWAVFAWVGLALSGCGGSGKDDDGGGDPPPSAATIQSFEGVYELTGLTHNAAGCDTEGASILESQKERSFVMVGAEALGNRYLSLSSCADAADCAAVVSAIRNRGPHSAEFMLTLSSEAGQDELGGFSASTGHGGDNGMCTQRTYETLVLTREGDAIRVESRLTPLADAPIEDGFCVAEPAKQRAEAEGRPCAELQVFSGTKVGPLP